jgi:hypothetical protein
MHAVAVAVAEVGACGRSQGAPGEAALNLERAIAVEIERKSTTVAEPAINRMRRLDAPVRTRSPLLGNACARVEKTNGVFVRMST